MSIRIVNNRYFFTFVTCQTQITHPYTFQPASLLAQQFIRDHNEVIKYFKADEKLILTEYLLQILSLKLAYQKSKDETLYQQYNKSEEDLKRQFWQVEAEGRRIERGFNEDRISDYRRYDFQKDDAADFYLYKLHGSL